MPLAIRPFKLSEAEFLFMFCIRACSKKIPTLKFILFRCFPMHVFLTEDHCKTWSDDAFIYQCHSHIMILLTLSKQESYKALESAFKILGKFYAKEGPRALLPADVKSQILEDLKLAEASL